MRENILIDSRSEALCKIFIHRREKKRPSCIFYSLRIVTPAGDKVLGKFFLGHSRETAYALYTRLQGTESLGPHHIIFFDFIETKNGMPLDLKLLACDLEQAALNVKIIVKDLFRSSL